MNQLVDALRHEKVFRDDFFYWLCSDVISMSQPGPPHGEALPAIERRSEPRQQS